MSAVRRYVSRVVPIPGDAQDREHAPPYLRGKMSGNPVEPLGSVCVYLCGLLAVIFMWDTSFTYNRAERH
jgi:hypothetical protein